MRFLRETRIGSAIIARALRAASFALCHLTHQTSLNCYLLLGLAIGLGIPTLLLVRDLQDKEGKPLFELPRMLLGLDSFVFEDYVDISKRLGDAVEEFLAQYKSKPTSLQPLAFAQQIRRPGAGETLKHHEETEADSDLAEASSPRENLLAPEIIDITNQLPRNTEACIRRPVDAIRWIVINHTGVRPEVGAERVAVAQMAKWPGIVSQFFITEDGEVQQTSRIDEVVTRDQEWIFQGINVYVAGTFDKTVPSDAQLIALSGLCRLLMDRHHLSDDAIRGVSEFITTRSPGLQWQEGLCWRDMLLNQVRSLGDSQRSDKEVPEAISESTPPPSTGTNPANADTGTIRVLVVDPDPNWREGVASGLASFPAEVILAEGLESALSSVTSTHLDLIITELHFLTPGDLPGRRTCRESAHYGFAHSHRGVYKRLSYHTNFQIGREVSRHPYATEDHIG